MNNKAVQNQINELKEMINNANDRISELEKQLENTKEVLKDGEAYYFINNYGVVDMNFWHNDDLNKYMLSIGNVYKTQEEAESIGLRKVFEQQLYVKLKRFADENNEGEIDWSNDTQEKYYIEYNYEKKIDTDYCYYYRNFQQDIFFTSRKIAEQAVEEFKDDLIKYFEV